ncbi:integrin beta-8-like isoform X1 [Salvelinus alpinus]|uniref:integrin beta-8-like isoform X1 n=1 Tax=Salvelinus alpinus TaxID=8036 RepID=UPI0039FD6B32
MGGNKKLCTTDHRAFPALLLVSADARYFPVDYRIVSVVACDRSCCCWCLDYKPAPGVDMTSWLRKYDNPVLLFLLLAANITSGSSRSGESVCSSPPVSSCSECLRRGPRCAWCFQEGFLDGAEVGEHCDLAVTLTRRGCGLEFIENPEVMVEVNPTTSRTQVSPGEITLTLRPGAEASVVVAVQQLERYPVDLYYLVDVSASMQDNLDLLKKVGVALSNRMREHSSDLRLGFGSFVDKNVSPYINVHPSKINNPCSDYEVKCLPAHGFHHVLSMTSNMSEFTRIIKRQRIAGNMDTPEGGLDAMLQATVCQGEVGWRGEAKRLLLLMTDQPSHLALDSRLAGIVTPHDGLCHLENSVYMKSSTMDHPSLGLLAEKLLENHIYSLFAVEQLQYQWYEELVRLLPGSNLLFQAPNLIDLVVDAYKRLLSVVQVSVSVEDRAFSRFLVSVSPLCPEGSESHDRSCSNVQPNQTVYFNITIGLLSCPDDDDEDDVVQVFVRPVGYNESAVINVRSRCRCHRCHDDIAHQSSCGEDTPDTDHNNQEVKTHTHLSHTHTSHTHTPELDLEHTHSQQRSRQCGAAASGLDCSGRGVCVCERCVCERNSLGTVYGTYCQMDDYSCPYQHELLCGGRGVCVSGECVCEEGWTGESCGCPVSTATCLLNNGLLCSGRGRCVCGRCVCDDHQHSGEFCERCPTCHSSCQSHWRCIDCHLSHGLSQRKMGHCNHTCTPLVGYVNDVTGEVWRQCVHMKDNCRYRFYTELVSGNTQLHINTKPECVSRGRYVGMFVSVCVLTFLSGLVMIAVLVLLLQRRSLPQGGATDTQYNPTGKDQSYIPTTNEKTTSYWRNCPLDQPMEMYITIPKMPMGEPWQ